MNSCRSDWPSVRRWMCVCCCPILALTLLSHLLQSSGLQPALHSLLASPINPRCGLICHHRHNNYYLRILEHRADAATYVPSVVTGCCMHFKNCVAGRIKAGSHCTQRKLSWDAKLPRGRKKKTYCIAPAPSANYTTTIGPSISRRRRLVLRTTTARNVFFSRNGTSETCPPLTKSSPLCSLLAKIVASGADSLQLPSRFSHRLPASPPIPPPTSLPIFLQPSPQPQHHLPPPPPPRSHNHNHSTHLRIQAQHHPPISHQTTTSPSPPSRSCAPASSQR